MVKTITISLSPKDAADEELIRNAIAEEAGHLARRADRISPAKKVTSMPVPAAV